MAETEKLPSDKALEAFGDAYQDFRQFTYERILDYMDEASHMGWEGFTTKDLESITKMMRDMKLYWDNAG